MSGELFNISETNFSYQPDSNAFRLNIINFSLSCGEIVFLHGRSGCGKSTLLNLLAGVIASPIAASLRHFFNSVGYVMHDSTLLPWLTIKKNIRVEENVRNKKCNISQFLLFSRQFGFGSDLLSLRPNQLSLGMRQRIEIAKALSFQPSLLLLDEALSGIDSSTKKEVARTLWKEVSENNITVIGTAHQVADLLMLAQRVYLIDGGRIENVLSIEQSVRERLNMDTEELYKLESTKAILRHA